MEKYRMGKLVFSFVGSYFFSIVLSFFVFFMAASFLDDQLSEILTTVFGVLIIIIAYVGFAWREGFRDFSRVSYGAMPKFMLKGGAAALIATSPVLLVILIYYGFLLTGSDPSIVWVFLRILLYPFLYLVTLTQNNPVLFLLIYLITPLICTFSYMLGYRRIKVSDKIIYKNTDKEKSANKRAPKLK